ncbi:unnamed protein product [Rangifer tarandus platyrhynchus]|uniref:Uncharacterized protein n=2 Tax=Rangifer tarandus platyrhynchus TaxID=3082113 RepID=A0ABN8ZMJ2_RANTA|nr:unnamed protein product [Rangifer tarandus platyrhynchus]CAI9708669.1 unnamed protein product [Rangifer tarandus platyrhynchus]
MGGVRIPAVTSPRAQGGRLATAVGAEGSGPQKRKGQSLHSGSRRRGPIAPGHCRESTKPHQAPLSSKPPRLLYTATRVAAPASPLSHHEDPQGLAWGAVRTLGRISLLGRPRTGSEEGTAVHPGPGMQATALSGPAGVHLPQCLAGPDLSRTVQPEAPA